MFNLAKRFKEITIYSFLTMVIIFLPWSALHYGVTKHAEHELNTELFESSQKYLIRTEVILNNAVEILQTLDRKGIKNCSNEARSEYQQYLRVNRSLFELGVADDRGAVMCVEPFHIVEKSLFPPSEKETYQLSFTFKEQTSSTHESLLISWLTDEGNRLFLRVNPKDFIRAIGFDSFDQEKLLSIEFDSGKTWFVTGWHYNPNTDQQPIESINLSKYFPLKVIIRIDSALISAHSERLLFIANITAVTIGIFILFTTIWITRRPRANDDIIRAMHNKEFVSFYQPVIDITTGEIRGAESLIRRKKRDGTIISAGHFMPQIETSRHIYEVTKSLMRTIEHDLSDIYEKMPHLRVSINLFAGHFDDRQIVDDIIEIFGTSKIDYSQLVFEITERQPLRDIEQARKVIAELRSLGCRVALDDTGTGHGGLVYLEMLGVDIIKIDKIFIDRLSQNDSATAIIDSLMELATSLNLGVVAEGVENLDQVQRLRMMGISAAQGFLFAKPLPIELYLKFVHSITSGSYIMPIDPETEKFLDNQMIDEEYGFIFEDDSSEDAA